MGSGKFTRGLRLGALVALATSLLPVGALGADDLGDLDWQAADGSFPEHGGCTYFGPREGTAPFQTAADDFRAMKMRTWDTRRVLAMIPRAQTRGAPVQPHAASAPVASAGCSGIDDCIAKTAEMAGVPLTYLTTDTEFLRRVRLDLTGRIPTKDEVLEFLADTSANKRERLVERLLGTPEWADRWAMYFGDLFRNTIRTAQVNRYQWGRDSLHLYLLESMQQNRPYDQMAREMLSAEGTSDGRTYPSRYQDFHHYQSTYGNFVDNPVRSSAVGYVVGGRTIGGPIQDTYDTLAFIVARDFLGISLMDCVLCHDGTGHLDALSVWGTNAKRLDAWKLAAFFSDVPRFQAWRYPGRLLPMNPQNGRRVNANYYFIHDLAQGETRATRAGDTAGAYLAQTAGGNRPDRLHTERFVAQEYPFAGNAIVNSGLRLREQVGLHLTADPQFARAAVNYIWRQFFSRGIVEPPDQFDLARLDPGAPPATGWELQPSHPHLLEWLADGFRTSGFDLKWLMREITTSETYQLSSRYDGVFNPLYDRYFVRHQVKRLTAEQVHDAIIVATGRYSSYSVSRTFRGVQFAMKFPDVTGVPQGRGQAANARMLLRAFTPGDREETARSGEGSPLQALNLMNNPFVLRRLATNVPTGTLGESLELSDDALVTNLYLSVMSRHPTEDEKKFAVDYLQQGNRDRRAASLMWALINKTDFYFNY